MNTTQVSEIISTVTAAHRKTFKLVGFEVSDYGFMLAYRSSLKNPYDVGNYFAKFGLQVSPRMQEDNGTFTLWFREVNDHA